MIPHKNIKIISNYFLGPVIFLILSYAIYHQLQYQHDWQKSWLQIKLAFVGDGRWKFFSCFLLMAVNWGLEALKWQSAIKQVQPIGFFKAFKAVLTGTTMAAFTPNRIGEYLGRILYIDETKRLSAIPLTICCSIAQLLITLIGGCIGLVYLQHRQLTLLTPLHLWINALLSITIVSAIAIAMVYFRLSWIVRLFERITVRTNLLRAVEVLEEFNERVLTCILFLSLVRYLVFVAQYFLLFSAFGVAVGFGEVAAGTGVLFLVMAVIPTFTLLSDLGVRWEAGIQVMTLFSANTVGIFATAFSIWLINLILPAVIGSLLILNIKLFRNK